MEEKRKDYSAYQELIFKYLNKVRTDPQSFIPLIQKELNYFKGQIFMRPGNLAIKTNEGAAAFNEAIEFLKKQEPLPELEYNETLEEAALDLIDDILPNGEINHTGRSNKNVNDRVEKYFEWEDRCCENIEVGGIRGYDTIIDLIVDDGNPGRTRRKNIFYNDIFFCGIGCGDHEEKKRINVIICTGNLRDKGELHFDYDNYKYEYPEEGKEKPKKKIVNQYQYDDPDAPDDAVGLEIKKEFKFYNNKKVGVIKKFYKLKDGTNHIVEVEEF